MAAALAILLDAPSYHCGTDGVGGDDAPIWAAAARKGELPDWSQLLDARGYASIGDAPACFYWADLAATYPDAIVLLVERGEPSNRSSWTASFDAALTAVAPFFRTRWRSRHARDAYDICTRMVTPHCPGKVAGALLLPDSYSRETLATWYERHYAAVRAAVPPERLAVIDLGGGWEPLCAALGLPVPDVAYPHKHVGAADAKAIFDGADAAMRPPVRLMVAAVVAAAAAAVGVWRATQRLAT
ncbi:hypothetical protein MMPV_005438 [Pyropia vietnamensis]